MTPTGWFFFVIVGFVTALNPVPHRTNEESLRGALNAVTRKQRSLDYSTREFYNNLPSLKYRGDDRRFERQREDGDLDEDEEELEFLPLENGQMEPMGDGYRGLNEKLLERALEDYAKSESIQEEPVPSLFRERERSASIKRGVRNDRAAVDDELARLFLDELEYGPYSQDEIDDSDYNTLQMLRQPQQNNRYYGNDGLVSWGEALEKKPLRERMRNEGEVEFPDRDQELYLMPVERRNVNSRYPLGRDFRHFGEMSKRFPVSKRSAKAVSQSKQVTDPKVAQDLGALFGTQSNGNNKSHTQEHGGHDHDHDHNLHESKAPQHGSEVHGMTGHNQEMTSAAPSVASPSKGQKENITKTIKPKERSIEVKKKSVNWSDYFGIDKRKKKSTFSPKPGSQNLDDEWFLERYYKTMAENLRSENENDGDDRKDKLQQMDSRLKNIKDLIIEEALNADGTDIQEVKDRVMSRLAAAYSLEKMRKALKEFRDNVISHREGQKLAKIQDNLTTNRPEGAPHEKSDEKRSRIGENEEGFDEGNTCPELEAIERHCRISGLVSHEINNVLHDSCVSILICRSCGGQECLTRFALEVERACESLEIEDNIWSREQCLGAARLLPITPPSSLVALCHSERPYSCLLRKYYQNHQRNQIFFPHDPNHRFGYENVISPQR